MQMNQCTHEDWVELEVSVEHLKIKLSPEAKIRKNLNVLDNIRPLWQGYAQPE